MDINATLATVRNADELICIIERFGQHFIVRASDATRLNLAENGIFNPIECPTCKCKCSGLEPVYPLGIAAALAGFENNHAFTQWLHANKKHVSRPLYKKARPRWQRLVSLGDICRIRAIIFNPFRRGRSPGMPETHVMRLANTLTDGDKKADLIVDEIERRAKQ